MVRVWVYGLEEEEIEELKEKLERRLQITPRIQDIRRISHSFSF
jgi:hypothetical protein